MRYSWTISCPGMDGLQAVKAIKGNPQTAMIPIMMYTSQEGELYVGQARALGAMGVLPKQVRPVDVSKVLYELHLLPDRRDMAGAGAARRWRSIPASAVERRRAKTGRAPADWGRRIETAVKDQAVDIRRFIVASLDSLPTRIISDVRDAHADPRRRAAWRHCAAAAEVAWPLGRPAMLAACLVAVAFAASWVDARNDLASARAEIAGLKSANAELQRRELDLTATVKDLTAALAAANSNARRNRRAQAPADPRPGAIAPRAEPVPYGEIAFDRSRLDVLRELLTKLEAQRFHGVVKITSSAGLFCLTATARTVTSSRRPRCRSAAAI